jgi:eukaryotic-like serine/threonine-protein kinase
MADTVEGRFTGSERFEVVRELGAGAMGVVYEVFDRQRNNTVALKTLKVSDGRKLFRFKQEFRSLAKLNHPNLIQLYELFADGDLWYFTMELVPGVTFMDYVCRTDTTTTAASTQESGELVTLDQGTNATAPIAENSPFRTVVQETTKQHSLRHLTRGTAQVANLDRVRESLRQLAVGLVELHSQGMLHRDIKPANVMVTEGGRVVLLDFGLVAEMNASQEQDSTETAPQSANAYETVEQGLAGTAAYMAPEQAQGKPLTAAGDWYAVGTILYQTLIGHVPFRGQLIEVLRKKIKDEPIPPIQTNPDVPQDLNDLCLSLLHRKPDLRGSGKNILQVLGGDATGDESASLTPAFNIQDIPFVGRENQVNALKLSLRMAIEGSTVVVDVYGASGMGKSTLIDHFVNLPVCDEAIVIQGRCYEQESVPYKAVDGLIDELTRYLMTLSDDELARVLPKRIGRLARLFPVLSRRLRRSTA